MLKNILVIDSDLENFNQIAANLRDDTTDVQYAATVQIALQKMAAFDYCLIILDVLLVGGGGGHEVIAELRKRTSMPILVLSEQAGTEDMVLALDSGADDFIAKPYDMDECLARTRVFLRRYTGLHPLAQRGYAVVSHDDILIDTARRMVSIAGQEIQLVRKEYELLIYFIKNRDLVLTYSQIYQGVWKEEYMGNSDTIIYHVGQLRKKLGDAVNIQSIRGVGYCLKLNESNFF